MKHILTTLAMLLLTVIVEAGETSGDVTLNVNAKGLKGASLALPVL